MLKQETIKSIATLLKLKEADLAAAITNTEEVDFELPKDITVLTQAELDTRDDGWIES